ncbi:MAG: helix-turn-helix domain-containing protein [Bdellovibrionales bacterium]|nr:helix-turn-helix domain-containing protein [Bdellovibrionales bacterium]
MSKQNESKLMNVEEAGSYLNIKRSRLYKATRNRELPFMRVGRLLRFEKQHLDQWIRDQHEEVHHLGLPCELK